MHHFIALNAGEFLSALKSGSEYVHKGAADNGTDFLVLKLNPKQKKLSVIACDGLGYYERKLNPVIQKDQPKPSLPGREMRLGIHSEWLPILIRSISPARGNLNLELEDSQISEGNFTVKLHLANGSTTTFPAKSEIQLPDYTSIRAKAEKGRKTTAGLTNFCMPVREMIRAGKAFPGNGSFARIYTTKADNGGAIALFEHKYDTADISVIFMLNPA